MRTPVLVLALALAAPAHAFIAQNGLVVTPQADGFSVPWRGLSGPRDFWCAAGDYAIRSLHLNPTDIVYRATPAKRGAGEAVGFTLDPAQSVEKTGLLILGATGGGITAGHAQALCESRRLRRVVD